MRSPRAMRSPDFFQQTTRRAISPAICLKVISPDSVARVMTFCSLWVEADSRMAAENLPGQYFMLVMVPAAGERFTWAFGIAEEVEDEGGEAEENYAGKCPAQKQGGSAERDRGQPEVVAFLDHAPRQYHSK